MSDESRTPDPEHGPDADHAAARDPERTGAVDVGDTRAIAPDTPGWNDHDDAHHDAIDHDAIDQDDAWFDVFGPAHPAEGAGVPERADAAWGSDRADALAEEAHHAGFARASGHEPTAPSGAPAVPRADAYWAPPSGAPHAGPVPSGPEGEHRATGPMAPGWVTMTDEAPAPPRRRRGLLVAGVVGLCLVSGVVGGVAGQLAEDAVHVGGSTLPTPGVGATVRPAGSVANIAATALPSVVTIRVDGGAEGSATGSGFVIDSKGHILTNNHVVTAASGEIDVVLSNGDTEKASVVGKDASYDLAVIKISRTDLTPLTLGSSDQVVVGDQVIAVGAPLGLDQTVTTGIVSALNRPVTPGEGSEASYINAIQTDAAINPGNSGGPLLDMTGQVIGVNSAIARVPGTAGSASGSIGLGFAIPSDQARRTADQLIATGKATHPVIGVKLDRTFSGEGAQVLDDSGAVTPDGPAAKAGVRPGDVITAFEGKRVRTPDQLIVSIRSRAVGDTVTLTVVRDGRSVDLKMTLEADPGS